MVACLFALRPTIVPNFRHLQCIGHEVVFRYCSTARMSEREAGAPFYAHIVRAPADAIAPVDVAASVRQLFLTEKTVILQCMLRECKKVQRRQYRCNQ